MVGSDACARFMQRQRLGRVKRPSHDQTPKAPERNWPAGGQDLHRSRASFIALLLILTTTLPAVVVAAGNAAPIVQAEASATRVVMGQQVTLTSTSYDPDGSVVETRWSFWDGRDMLGTSVTRSFDFPGSLTITLRVTDDEGATASTDIRIEVVQPKMHGHAWAFSGARQRAGDSGNLWAYGPTSQRSEVGYQNGQLRVDAADGHVFTADDPAGGGPRAIARTAVGYVYIPVPVGYILLTGVESELHAHCEGATLATAKFSQVRLNDAPLVPPGEVPPDTRIELPGAITVRLNVPGELTGQPDRHGVTAAIISIPGEADITIAHAEAGVSDCP